MDLYDHCQQVQSCVGRLSFIVGVATSALTLLHDSGKHLLRTNNRTDCLTHDICLCWVGPVANYLSSGVSTASAYLIELSMYTIIYL
jgi:hypothetical protein